MRRCSVSAECGGSFGPVEPSPSFLAAIRSPRASRKTPFEPSPYHVQKTGERNGGGERVACAQLNYSKSAGVGLAAQRFRTAKAVRMALRFRSIAVALSRTDPRLDAAVERSTADDPTCSGLLT